MPTSALCLLWIAMQSPEGAADPHALDDEADRKFRSELERVEVPFPPEVLTPEEIRTVAELGPKFFVDDDELVVGLDLGGAERAYPLRFLSVPEALNDELGGVPLLVTWCMMCQIAVVYERRADGRVLTFGNHRALHESSAVLYDVETSSLWVQADGRCAAGPLRGTKLPAVDSALVTWRQWRDTHPGTTVLVGPNARGRRRDLFLLWEEQVRSRMGWVIRVGDEARHYPLSQLPREGLVEDEVAGLPVVIAQSVSRKSIAAYRREVDGARVEFAPELVEAGGAALLAEANGPRRWRIDTGALQEPEAGSPLERVVSHPIRTDKFEPHFPKGTSWSPAEGKPAWTGLAELEQALAAGHDWFGEAVLKAGADPTYEDFARLLPPLRFVNTEFAEYPIVLSAPRGRVKARFVSDGRGVNVRAGTRTWRDDGLVPFSFFVRRGSRSSERRGREIAVEPFGSGVDDRPNAKLAEGWLPIVETRHLSRGVRVRQQAFAAVDVPGGVDDAVVFHRFELEPSTLTAVGGASDLVVRIGSEKAVTLTDSLLRDASGRLLAWCDPRLTLDAERRELIGRLRANEPLHLAVFTRGVASGELHEGGPLHPSTYLHARAATIGAWRELIDGSIQLATGEQRVDDAWRAVVVGTWMLANDDVLNYSAGNLYEQTFQAECGDAVRALLELGVPGSSRLVEPLLARPLQPGIELSDVGHKLQLLAFQHELLRDPAKSRAALPLVLPQAEAAIAKVEPATRLVPGQSYCGDLPEKGHNLVANAVFWRGLRDVALMLRELGGEEEIATAARLEAGAASLREAIHAAVAKSERTDVAPPFVPIALFGAEQPYEQLTATRQGSYWNLLAPYVYESDVFGADSPRTKAMLDWQLTRGGVALGMVRFDQHSGLFANEKGVDDLYSLRLVDELLRRDEVGRALVAFYGKLAQGMTPDTCIGGEGSSLVPMNDDRGRAMYLPPNCAANAFFLSTLRGLLVQDLDLDADGRAETLRLLFATPRAWLANGGRIKMKRAPTKFGEVSLEAVSELDAGRITVELDLPPRAAAKTLLRLRAPGPARIASATIGETALPRVDDETIDLSGRSGHVSLVVNLAATR